MTLPALPLPPLRFAVLIGATLSIGAAAAFAQGAPGGAPEATRVVVNAVRTEPMSQTVPVLGRFVARQTGVVAARVSGAIGEFRVDVGDRVTEGDLIAVLLKERLQWEYNLKQAEVANYSAQVRTKQRELKLLQQELERLRSLRNSPAVSQARLDDKLQQVSVAESSASEAEARLRMANANLRLSGISLHDAEVRAPYAGVVTKRHVEVGAYVGVGAPVVTLVDDKNMEIEADVPAARTTGLVPNTIVSAVIDGTTRIDAAVRAVIPEENPRTRTRAVRFIPAFGGADSKVADNQSVTLLLPAGETREVVTVHKDAILDKGGRRLVVLVQGGKAAFRPVDLGDATGSRFSVKSGLKPGDLVVVRGNERLRPGMPLSHQLEPGVAGTGQGGGEREAEGAPASKEASKETPK